MKTRLLLAVVFLGLVAAIVLSQPKAAPAETAPALKTEDLLKIRELQFEQAKRVISRQELEREYTALLKEIETGRHSIVTAFDVAMKNANIDRAKWDLNVQTLQIVARPSPTPTPTPE